MARKFLYVMIALILLVVAGAFVYRFFGKDLMKAALIPSAGFEGGPTTSQQAYEKAGMWFARPDIPNNPALWTPADFKPGEKPPVAVFFIHPTSYIDRRHWNAPLDDVQANNTAAVFLRGQASAFNEIGEVWAPRYRQATFGAFLTSKIEAQKALDFAYRDVLASFDEFLKEVGPDRPIILAGHSQGALHLERLLRERVAGRPLTKRIVAAYVVGWPISTIADLPALGLPACTSPEEAGCIVSWMTFGDPPNPDFIFHEWSKTTGFNGGERRREETLCVNPISGVQNGSAPPQDNPGTLIPTADMRNANLQPGAVGAHCRDGLLILDGMPPELGSFVLPGNNYHVYDYALFWGAIRRDAARRLAAWRG